MDCRYDDPLLKHTSAVVVAESFVKENYAEIKSEDLFRAYQAATSGLVIFTHGDRPLWFARPDQAIRCFRPYPLKPVDTTGGGDALRAGIVYGFLQGWDDEASIRFATAVAAIIWTRFPGVSHAPMRNEVFDFMASQRPL